MRTVSVCVALTLMGIYIFELLSDRVLLKKGAMATFKSSYTDLSRTSAATAFLNESNFLLELIEPPNTTVASSNTDPGSVPPRTIGDVSRR